MKAINKIITAAIALVGSSLMCMMKNDVAHNNTVLFELSQRLRAEYNQVAHTTYTNVTVQGLDGQIVNLHTIIHQLLHAKQQNDHPEKGYVCESSVLDRTLYDALRLDLNRGMALLRDQEITLSDYDFVLKDLKYKLDLFAQLNPAQDEFKGIEATLQVLDVKRDELATIEGIRKMGMR
jgi:hypothetical protein